MSSMNNRTRIAVYTGILALVVAGLSTVLFVVDPERIQIAQAPGVVSHFEVLTAYICMAVALMEYRLLSYSQPQTVQDALETNGKGTGRSVRLLRKDWVGASIVSFAIAWMLTTACQAVFHFVVSPLLPAWEVSREAIMLLFTLYGGLLGFGVSYYIIAEDDFELNALFTMLLVGGGLFCLQLIGAKQAETLCSISALVTTPARTFFRVTMVVVGLVALIMARDMVDGVRPLVRQGVFPLSAFNVIRFGLTGIGVGIIGVGVFPVQQGDIWGPQFDTDLHYFFAYSMGLLCVLGILFVDVYARGIYRRQFVYASLGFGVICILVLMAWPFRKFIGVELSLFTVFTVWVWYFRKETWRLIRAQPASAMV